MASGTERHSSNILEKFKITVKKKDGTMFQKEVEGYRINIPECPDAKLFVHPSHDGQDLWCITEEESGFRLCVGASKPAAVGRARRIVTAKYDKYPTAISNAVRVKEEGFTVSQIELSKKIEQV